MVGLTEMPTNTMRVWLMGEVMKAMMRVLRLTVTHVHQFGGVGMWRCRRGTLRLMILRILIPSAFPARLPTTQVIGLVVVELEGGVVGRVVVVTMVILKMTDGIESTVLTTHDEGEGGMGMREGNGVGS